MLDYESVARDLERHLLSQDLFWHQDKAKDELSAILKLIKELKEFELEVDESKRELITHLHNTITKLYSDIRITAPDTKSVEEINSYLKDLAAVFEKRYAHVRSSPGLKRVFRKYGCEILFKKRIDVENEVEIKGPALLVCGHKAQIEPHLIQSLTHEHIYWIADPYWNVSRFRLRWFSVPYYKSFIKSLGPIEIDRSKPARLLRQMLRQSQYVFESNGIVGIMPEGHIPSDYNYDTRMFQMGHSGFIAIVQYAQEHLKRKIPIIPIGVKRENYRWVVKFGKVLYLPDGNFNRSDFENMVRDYINELS